MDNLKSNGEVDELISIQKEHLNNHQMPQPKISIIIPAYNAEAHLEECLDSASQQTFRDIEIICVDDCSTDSTGAILARRESSDSRIRIIRHAENKGEGGARNTGLDAARGDYVFHLDADDTIPRNTIEILYNAAAVDQCDLVRGHTAAVDDVSGEIINIPWPEIRSTRISNINIHKFEFLQNIPGSHCGYLYKRRFLETFNIRYPTNLLVGLDVVALAKALIHAKSVTLLPEVVYHYRQTKNSMTRGNVSEKIALDAIMERKIISDMLRVAGFSAAASMRLRRWNWIIDSYWIRMPSSLNVQQCKTVFAAFRKAVSNVESPWEPKTPIHRKYLMALILAGHDDEAFAFLTSLEMTAGFSNETMHQRSLDFVLSQVPDDEGTLLELGRLESRQGDLQRASGRFEKVLNINPGNIDAMLGYAIVLRKQGQPAKAHIMLDKALNDCIDPLTVRKIIINNVIEEKRCLFTEEKQVLQTKLEASNIESERLQHRLSESIRESHSISQKLDATQAELDATKNELASIYSSILWRMTASIRKAMLKLKICTRS